MPTPSVLSPRGTVPTVGLFADYFPRLMLRGAAIVSRLYKQSDSRKQLDKDAVARDGRRVFGGDTTHAMNLPHDATAFKREGFAGLPQDKEPAWNKDR